MTNKLINNENIETMIYEVRGKQVMLDSTLALLYEVETKRINEAVRNNPEKFPERFSFRITDEELENLKSKISTSSHGGRRNLPRAFTEQGIAMISTILKSKKATQVSIKIMDTFVAMRKYISNNLIEQKYINNQVLKNTEDIKLLQESFEKFEEKRKVNEIYYKGQIYDAYSKIVDIFKSANKELIIVDAYADKSILDMVKNIEVKVILICKINSLLNKLDIEKYHKQYDNLKIIYSDNYHDRYFIIDRKIIYHCGASINHAGSKTFSINILEDEIIKKTLINNINNLLHF